MAFQTTTAGAGYGSIYVDSLVYGTKWSGGTLTYHLASGSGGAAWSASERAAITNSLALFESIINVDFSESLSRSGANFVWHQNSSAFFGSSNVLGMHELPWSGTRLDGWFNYQHPTWSTLTPGSVGFATILHEIGHGMGLDHPHDAAEPFPGVNGNPWSTGSYGLNQQIWTVMSYNDGWTSQPTPSDAYGSAGSLMAFDIAALQELYGANLSYRTGDDVYRLADRNAPGTYWSCIWDSGGSDTISNENSALACRIDLRDAPLVGSNAGGFVSRDAGIVGGFTIANNVVIENAIGGSGADTLTGNGADNRLVGGAGNDNLNGLEGADTMIGGTGNDIYVMDDVNDAVVETEFGGTDTIKSSVFFGPLFDFVERLTLTGLDAISGIGNSAKNVIVGNSAANVLDGMGGADSLIGGAGNDTYILGTGDTITETATGGTDTVVSSADYVLGAYLENLVLDGAALKATGNGLANALTGNALNNMLNGAGGIDTMTGGDGDDLYIVNHAGDRAIENAGEGLDAVRASVSYMLSDNVENLIATGTAAIRLTGNDLGNTLTGNAASNVIDGGAGADTMTGGLGNDTYYADETGDVVVETSSGGADQVFSSATFALSANVERLTLTGTDDIDGTGNSLANRVYGNAGANVLEGDAGNDALFGGDGNDTLIGGIGADTLVGGLGADTFYFAALTERSDRVVDFVSGEDRVEIQAAGFAGAAAGNVFLESGSTAAAAGTAATFLFDTDDGRLFWDADGAGGNAALLLTTLSGVRHLSDTDLFVV